MKKERVKESLKEIIDGVKCILDSQTDIRPKQECVLILKKPVHEFCDIARKTEKRVQKTDSHYEISRFLGARPYDRRKMGVVCSEDTTFPKCDESIEATSWDKSMDLLPNCKKEVDEAIKNRPIEKSQDWSKLLTSFETMRDWMHVSGYSLPDYVWVVPKGMREKVKEVFQKLSSEQIRNSKDLEQLANEIDKW